jgi:hypothetical protein
MSTSFKTKMENKDLGWILLIVYYDFIVKKYVAINCMYDIIVILSVPIFILYSVFSIVVIPQKAITSI